MAEVDLRSWWYRALCDMLQSVPPGKRLTAEWHMSYRLFTMVRDIMDLPKSRPVFSWNPQAPYPDVMLLGKPVEFFDQDFVSIHA